MSSCGPVGQSGHLWNPVQDPVFYETSRPDSAEMAINSIYVPCLLGSAMTPAVCLPHLGGGSWHVEDLGVESHTGLHSISLAQPRM